MDIAMKIVRQKDFTVGLLYMAVGAAFAVASWGYRMGTASRMGPGYLPFWLGVIMAFIGALVLWGAVRASAEPERHERWSLKPLFIVLGSVVAFGVLLEPLGLVISVIVLVAGTSLASPESTWRATLFNTIALLAITIVLFVYVLSLQFPIWPAFITG
jgi:hypothetical protein